MSHWIRAQMMLKVQRNIGKNTSTGDMVCGYNLKVRRPIRMASKESSDPAFLKACEKNGIKPTVRQRNKFARKTGAAYAAHISTRNNADPS